MEVPEILILNEAALDVEELEARMEMSSLVPNTDCWVHDNCYRSVCGINTCT